MHFRCGGIINERFIPNLLLNVAVRHFENQPILSEDTDRSLHGCFLNLYNKLCKWHNFYAELPSISFESVQQALQMAQLLC